MTEQRRRIVHLVSVHTHAPLCAKEGSNALDQDGDRGGITICRMCARRMRAEIDSHRLPFGIGRGPSA